MLKETMLAPETNVVWRMVRAAYEVPDPAVGFSEAKWASLLFESNCNVSAILLFSLAPTPPSTSTYIMIVLTVLRYEKCPKYRLEPSEAFMLRMQTVQVAMGLMGSHRRG